MRVATLHLKISAFLLAGLLTHANSSVASAESLVLEGGTVHSLAGEAAPGSVVIVDGRIHAVGPGAEAPAGATRINISGLHVYPGLFDSLSTVGLVEVGAISATVDTSEMGSYNPHLKAATAIHPASEIIPVTRANGITQAISAPTAGGRGPFGGDSSVVLGQAALIQLDGWTVEEMTLDDSVGMVIAWPQIQTRSFDFTTFTVTEASYNDAKKKAEEAQDELLDWLDAARHYAMATASDRVRTERDLKLEALGQILDGKKRVIILAQAKRDIEAAVKFAGDQGLDIIIAGGRDAWQVTELLVEKNIPVILGSTQSLPQQEDDPYDRPFANASKLVAAGIPIAFASGAGGGRGPGGPHSARTLPYEAAMAAAYGLSREDALKALTVWPAQILGMEEHLGTIEKGKIANLIVTDGNPLELTSQVRHLLIGGREVSTDNKHRSLYERYRSRPMAE